MKHLLCTLALALLSSTSSALTPATAPTLDAGAVNADGLRDHDYRTPPPPTVAEAVTIDTADLQQLMHLHGPSLVLLDVMAVPKRPASEQTPSAWIPSKVRQHIPGSVWLPNVGYANLPPEMEQFFQQHLQRLTDGDPQRPIVMYCIADCWMSWNAIRRAARYGYTQLYWYRDGTDGWKSAGLSLVDAEPVPPPEAAAKRAK